MIGPLDARDGPPMSLSGRRITGTYRDEGKGSRKAMRVSASRTRTLHKYVRPVCTTRVPRVYNLCATCVLLVYHLCATCVPHVCHLCTTGVPLVYHVYATCVPHVCHLYTRRITEMYYNITLGSIAWQDILGNKPPDAMYHATLETCLKIRIANVPKRKLWKKSKIPRDRANSVKTIAS